MRVSFSVDLKPKSGKQNFAIQLARAMKRKGVKVTHKNPHVNLVFVKGIREGCKNILRLDGAWINSKMNSTGKNKKIARTMKKCDAVIYQSRYSKRVCESFIGKKKHRRIIFNGCDPASFRKSYEHNKPYVLACSRWRPHKRLKEIVEGFLDSGLHSSHDLFVCGADPDYKKDHPSVRYLGKQPIDMVYLLTAGCHFVAHLASLDCCPNSVVEAIVAGKNVLHADSGGTHEIAKNSGYCIKDKSFDFKLFDLYKPYQLDHDDVIKGYRVLSEMPTHNRSDLHIDDIADQYITYIRKFA